MADHGEQGRGQRTPEELAAALRRLDAESEPPVLSASRQRLSAGIRSGTPADVPQATEPRSPSDQPTATGPEFDRPAWMRGDGPPRRRARVGRSAAPPAPGIGHTDDRRRLLAVAAIAGTLVIVAVVLALVTGGSGHRHPGTVAGHVTPTAAPSSPAPPAAATTPAATTPTTPARHAATHRHASRAHRSRVHGRARHHVRRHARGHRAASHRHRRRRRRR